ncbi:hypothetical protein BS627_03580 [Agrobacterium salinitolerans]|nr:hypothetical protein BS627_03580 [Agrobacterium salinitolerans]PNQ25706.1 hypothetical protein C2E26_03630 [Rhizobium sp. YIC5082]
MIRGPAIPKLFAISQNESETDGSPALYQDRTGVGARSCDRDSAHEIRQLLLYSRHLIAGLDLVAAAITTHRQVAVLDRTKPLASEFGAILQLAFGDVFPIGFASCEAEIRERYWRLWSAALDLMTTSCQRQHCCQRSEELRKSPHGATF